MINGTFSLQYPLACTLYLASRSQLQTVNTDRGHQILCDVGCGILVSLSLWSTLEMAYLLPDGGTIDHLLWTLLFLKMYSNQKALCSLAGGVDATTF